MPDKACTRPKQIWNPQTVAMEQMRLLRAINNILADIRNALLNK